MESMSSCARDDLADRSVFLHLPAIADAERRVESEFWRSFRAEYPAILGGLLSAVADGLHELSSIRLPELPRMADFACLGEAVGRGLGWPEGTFVSAYKENRHAASLISLEDSALATALLAKAKWRRLKDWTLCASDMMKALAILVRPSVRASGWPKTPREFADELRRLAPQLRMARDLCHVQEDGGEPPDHDQYRRALRSTRRSSNSRPGKRAPR